MGLFQGCSSLIEVDCTRFNTENDIQTSSMFMRCQELKKIKHKFNFPKITDMDNMVTECEKLENVDLSKCTTSNSLTNIEDMFSNCLNLKSIDLSKFNCSNVINLGYLFYLCE